MTKIDIEYPFISFETSFVEIEQYVGRKQNLKKKIQIFEKHLVFFKLRNCSNKTSFDTSFVKIEHMYWQKTKIKKKLDIKNIHFS